MGPIQRSMIKVLICWAWEPDRDDLPKTLPNISFTPLPWTRQQSLPRGRTACPQAAPSVAVCQAPINVARDHEVSGSGIARSAGLSLLDQADAQFPVGDTVILSPRAGCWKTPVLFDERDVETEHGRAIEAPSDERDGQRLGST